MAESKKYSLIVNLIAVLTSTITLVVSIAYVVACAVALLYHGSCTVPTGDGVFPAVYTVYFENPSCREERDDQSLNYLEAVELTRPFSVYIMVILTLTAALLCIIAASSLLFATASKEGTQYLRAIVVFYITSLVISLVIDITFATHFGLDYSSLTNLMTDELSTENRQYLRLLRIGVMLLLTITLKGFLIPLINIVYAVLLSIYLVKFHRAQKIEGHPIHKLGSLYAYRDDMYPNSPRQNTIDTAPVSSPSPVPTLSLQPHVEPKPSPKPDVRDYRYNRSISDQHHEPQQPAFGYGSRPFSYLEDPSPAAAPPRFNRPANNMPPNIPVPEPDYSPVEGRRLKSALKNTYM